MMMTVYDDVHKDYILDAWMWFIGPKFKFSNQKEKKRIDRRTGGLALASMMSFGCLI